MDPDELMLPFDSVGSARTVDDVPAKHSGHASTHGPDDHPPKGGAINMIRLDLLDPSPHQARIGIDDNSVRALAESIREVGVTQPILVRREGERYKIVDGHRRVRAVEFLQWLMIPAIVISVDERDAARSTMAANHNGRMVRPFERMREVAVLDDAHQGEISGVRIARILDVKPSTVSEYRGYAAKVTPEILVDAGIDIDDLNQAGLLRSLKRDQLREIAGIEDPSERARRLREIVSAVPKATPSQPLDLDSVVTRTLGRDGRWTITVRLDQVPEDQIQRVRRRLTQYLDTDYRAAILKRKEVPSGSRLPVTDAE